MRKVVTQLSSGKGFTAALFASEDLWTCNK